MTNRPFEFFTNKQLLAVLRRAKALGAPPFFIASLKLEAFDRILEVL